MLLATQSCLDAITTHSAALADAAEGHLQVPVEHCPGWSVADLVWHVAGVHWFWGTIVDELLTGPPPEDRRPARPADDALLDVFRAGAARLVQVLGDADQSAHCWTWAGWQQDVAFVTRHQVQEAAVHHWDAAHAAGLEWSTEPQVAADCVDEFLHFSVASDDDPDEPTQPPFRGELVLVASDTGDVWTITDGKPGTARVSSGAADAPTLRAPAQDLLLWLYARTTIDTRGVPDDLLSRFRGLTFTD